MKKILCLMLIIMLTGCSNEMENEILELRDEVSRLNEEKILLLDTISANEKHIDELEKDVDERTVELKNLQESIDFLPEYITSCIGDYSDRCISTLIPEDSFLFLDKGKTIGGYKVLQQLEGPCEAAVNHIVYEDEVIKITYSTNAGCNPEWIVSTPILIKVDESLVSVSDAIKMEYITLQDLLDKEFFKYTYK